MNNFTNKTLLAIALSGALTVVSAEEQSTEANEETSNQTIIVTADLQNRNVLELPASVTVIGSDYIERKNAQQLTDIVNYAPNVNFASGSSRGRFIQIRGVGERSEFREPVNYSVGVVLDGVDLTGISTAATMLDIQQVEILRGPQGTLYGANGLAGLINIVSNAATDDFYSKLSASYESFSGREVSGVISGPISNETSYRVALKQFNSDGYMKNIYLGRDDTNNLDEFSLRGKLAFNAGENLTINTSLFLADIDNGYDAFSLDSNRNTYSDQPGHDRQETQAIALQALWDVSANHQFEAIFSMADSNLEYGYDEDWSHVAICENTECDSDLHGFDWWYSSFDNYQRDNKNTSLDVKFRSLDKGQSINWVVGAYIRNQQVDLDRQYTFAASDFASRFDTNNTALYGEVNFALSTDWQLTTGLRFENRSADYADSFDARFKPDEDLWGGKLAIEYKLANNQMAYGLISRGYKAGGFNTDASIPLENREFDTETMWNYEAGVKGNWLNNQLIAQFSIFYQDRQDVQTKESIVRSIDSGLLVQLGGECPCSFTDLTGNAAKGNSWGVELDSQWLANENLSFYLSLGLLNSQFDDYQSYTHIDADLESLPPVPFDLDGRRFAHAPSYQATTGINYYFTDQWQFNAEVESKSSFYFSDRHQEKSDSYQLLNLGVSYLQENWRLRFYAKNITDEDVQTRGFGSFGNDPRNFYERGTYYQFAASRVIGIAFSTEFE